MYMVDKNRTGQDLKTKNTAGKNVTGQGGGNGTGWNRKEQDKNEGTGQKKKKKHDSSVP